MGLALERIVVGFRSLRDPLRALFVVASIWMIGSAVLVPPRTIGDGAEYQMMAESLARHLSPDMQAGDVAALAGEELRQRSGLHLAAVYPIYFDDGQGRWYCYHFWGYSLATVPVRWLLRAVRANELAALQITNALLFLWALHQALFGAALERRGRAVLGVLFLFSPIAWFVLWPHPEAACAALVLVAALWAATGRRAGAVLCAALAAMQNPPLVWLVGALWLYAWLPTLRPSAGSRRGWVAALLRSSAAATPALFSPLFFLWKFGTPSLVARSSADPALMSLRRTLELFLDLNLGLLPYVPLALVLFTGAIVAAVRRPRREGRALVGLVVLGLMAYTCTATHNWNHGTAGPSRYTIWMLPLILVVVVEWLGSLWAGTVWRRRAAFGLAGLALLTQATVLLGRGGLSQGDDSLDHSWAARLVLHLAPRLYNPSPEIFVSRTNHTPTLDGYAVYRDDACRKARARPSDARRLQEDCGFLPEGSAAFFAQQALPSDWAYVDY